MWRRVATMIIAGLAALVPATAVAGSATVDRLENFGTVLATAMPADFPVASLMRADCSSLLRIERPDGSASEVMDCQLSQEPVMIPAFQGTPPSRAFVLEGGACMWISDYFANTTGEIVLASTFRYTVTPSGHVHARAEFPAAPISCE